MAKSSDEDLAQEAVDWAYSRYFNKVPAKGIPDYRSAAREWIQSVKKIAWVPAFEDRIVEIMDQKARAKAAKNRKISKKSKRAAEEREKQSDLFD